MTAVDPTGLDAELLDCYDDNLQVLARHAGAEDVFTPFARDWGFADAGVHREPRFCREPVERRLSQDTGLVVTWHPAARLAELVDQGRPVFAQADAYAMPWLPYCGNTHMTHSFVVDAVDGGTARIADAYHNDTAHGPARPVRTTLDRTALDSLLGSDARVATLEPGVRPAPPGPAEVVVANAEALDVSALRGYPERVRGELDDRAATEALALACWLGVRSRTRYARWLAGLPGADGLAARFADEVVPAWKRTGEQAYIARLRAERGRAVPGAAFAGFAGAVADAEEAAAQDSTRTRI